MVWSLIGRYKRAWPQWIMIVQKPPKLYRLWVQFWRSQYSFGGWWHVSWTDKCMGCFVSVTAAAAGAAAGAVVVKVTDNLENYYNEKADVYEFWNDWQARDQRSHLEGTHNQGRFSREHRTLGIVNERWYCCLTRKGAIKRNIPLDRWRPLWFPTLVLVF